MLINQDLQNQRKQLEEKLMAIRNIIFYLRSEEHGHWKSEDHYMIAKLL
jgi:hypothetical protein